MLLPYNQDDFLKGDSIAVPFADRYMAGRVLAKALEWLRDNPEIIVLALPRGGVPVAKEVAVALHAPLDLLLVHKVCLPGNEELAMGAVASNDVVIWNNRVVNRAGVNRDNLDYAVRKALEELHHREKVFRGIRPQLDLKDRIVVLVDDGLSSGASMRAAIEAARKQQPGSIIVAVPVAPPEKLSQMKETADEVVCLITPEPFYCIGDWYLDFSRPTDNTVRELLFAARENANVYRTGKFHFCDRVHK